MAGAMGDLRAIAVRLGGEVASGAISCPGPGHSRADRSLRVYLDPMAPNGYRVESFAGDDWRDCRAHVDRLLGFELWRPQRPQSPAPAPRLVKPAPEQDNRNHDLALSIFNNGTPIAGTIAETYLIKRLGRVTDWPADLRFHPKCPRGTDQKLPALVCLLRDIRTDEPRAIQRVFLQADGSDRLRDSMGKATLGPAANAVCKLSPDDAVTHGLGLIEGVEKGLALMSIGWAPIWVTCGTSGLSTFPVLSGVSMLTAFADGDGPGQKAALACARRWAAAGTRARVITPRAEGKDWDDALRDVA